MSERESESDDNSCQSESKSAELLADELFECCKSDCLSEEGVREIIERYELSSHYYPSDYQFFQMACCNVNITEEIIQCLLEYFPPAAIEEDEEGQLPLHYACNSDDVPLGVIQLLIDAAPDSVRCEDNDCHMPLHTLCSNTELEERKALQILKLLLAKCPESIGHMNNQFFFPIHIAAISKSPEFLSVLIEAYPGSERLAGPMDMLPIHFACTLNSVTTVEYLYNFHPDTIHHATSSGIYPIHVAIGSLHVDVVKFLLGCDPNVKFQEFENKSLLLSACLRRQERNDANIGAALKIIEVIYDAHPDSIREENDKGDLLLHRFCSLGYKKFDGIEASEILKLLLEKFPESIRHANNGGCLPIHIAALVSKSPEFCRLLIEAYPGSERMAGPLGMLPIHCACMGNTVAAVEYLYNLYPAGINHAAAGREEVYPIYLAISSMVGRNKADPEAAVDIVKFLLGCDARVKLQRQIQGLLSLSAFAFTYLQDYNDTNIGAALEIIKAIYDAHPQAINSDEIASHIHRCHPQLQTFLINELIYSLQARDSYLMTIPDGIGQLPLHAALRNNVRLGSIKLLVEGYPPAVHFPDISGALPLHIACMHHESASVVQYLVELDRSTLDAVDDNNNTALHYACCGAKYETIALLLGKYDAVSVSKLDTHKKLPIDLLWGSNEVIDRESVEYTEVVFQLVKAYPETVMNWM